MYVIFVVENISAVVIDRCVGVKNTSRWLCELKIWGSGPEILVYEA